MQAMTGKNLDPTPEQEMVQRRALMRCTPLQMRLALHDAGLLTDVEAIVANDPRAGIAWEYATVFERTSPFIVSLSAGHFTDDQIDELFLLASQM